MTTARRERIRIAALLTASLAAASIDVGTFQAAAPASLAWQAVSGGPMGGAATELVEPISGVLLARVNDVLYRSTDDGRSWLPCRDLPPPSSVGGRPPSARPLWFWSTIAHRQRPNAEATRIPAPDTIELTDPRCEQFGAVNVPPWGGPRGDELAFVAGSNARVAVTPTGVFRSTEPVSTWAQVLAFPRRGRVCAAQNGLGLFVVSDTQLYESTDGGATWRTVPEDPDASRTGTAAAGRSPKLGCPFIRSSNYFTHIAAGPDGLWWWFPEDRTSTWKRIHQGPERAFAATERRVSIVTGSLDDPALMRSSDDGSTWTTIPLPLAKTARIGRLVDTVRGTLLAATDAGIYRSTDRGESWTLTGVQPDELTLGSDRQQTYASDASGLWATRDGGASWRKLPAQVDGRPWTPKHRLTRVFDAAGRSAAVVDGRLYRVEGDGTAFVPAGLDKEVTSIVHVRDAWYASTREGVFRSSDFERWSECSLGLGGGGVLVVIGRGDLLSGASSLSTDGCRSWWSFDSRHSTVPPPFLFARRDVVVGIGAGISRLDLGSREWTTVKDSTEIQATMAVEDARGRYWLATTQGVHALMPDAYGWEVFPMGLQREEVVSLSVDRQGYLIAATRGHGLYRARLP